MAIPTGEIIARPMMARACGCMCEFQHYAVDKYRAQRLAKFQHDFWVYLAGYRKDAPTLLMK